MDLDKELYHRFLQGDIAAFEKLVIGHKNGLIFFIERYIKDFHQAEDIAQEVFAYIFAFKERYNFKYSFTTYIYTLARNKSVDYLRKHSRVVLMDSHDQVIIEDSLIIEESVIKKQEQRQVMKALKTLKGEYQVAIYLVDFMEFSYKEAAKILGKSQPQFKILLYRARQRLKDKLEREGFNSEE